MDTLDIILIRHAESEFNAYHSHKIGGRSNWAELTPTGIEQAKLLGRCLREEHRSFSGIYASPAVRTQQTARYSLEELGIPWYAVQIEPDLQELDQGDWEGQLREPMYGHPRIQAALEQDNWNFVPGNTITGESQAMTAARMKRWLEKVIHNEGDGGNILAYTHGMAIKFLLTELFGYDKKTAYQMPIDNNSINIISYHNSTFEHTVQNDTRHLQTQKPLLD